jgi:hypothetical protein
MYYLLIVLSLLLWSCGDSKKETSSLSSNVEGFLPVPTEFSIKKSKRKEFKKGRKDYIKNMHRAHPDDNWKEMDVNTSIG